MRQKLTLLISLSLLALAVVAQKSKKFSFVPGQKKPELFGIAFNLSDFNAPKNFKNDGNAATIPISQMAPGVSISYWKGLTPFIDFSAKLNGIFYNYSAIYYGTTGKTEIGLELEPTINIRPIKDENIWNPFLTAGLGMGLYTNHMGAYIPLGAGVQFNSNSFTYFFLQAQYKWSITPSVLGDNLFYSIGFAQNIGNEEPYVAPKAPLPTPPAAPVVLDRDNDGVPDATDACPDIKGLVNLKGCPDSDGDGIADSEDKCPTIKGLLKYGGCPIPDTDKDGINDEEDKCPDVAGFARYQGCPVPDTDGDGIDDEEDKCPKLPGMASNYGCPDLTFYYKKEGSVLSADDKADLDKVVAFLNNNPALNVIIEGHTSTPGAADYNKKLSQKRADNAVAYLVSKGIDKSRLTAVGYGEEFPVGDNSQESGRAASRRIVVRIDK